VKESKTKNQIIYEQQTIYIAVSNRGTLVGLTALVYLVMGVGRGGKGSVPPPWISYMMPLMSFSTSTRFMKSSQLLPTILVFFYAG